MLEVKTVLLVDDCEADRYIARRRLLKKWPHLEILEAVNGADAAEQLDSAEALPDLIFLDINMPRMGGHEFLEHWYAANGREVPVVVMLSSSDQKSDIERAKAQACVCGFIVKPITPEHLEELSIRNTAGPEGQKTAQIL